MLNKLQINYCPETDSYIREKVRVVLHLSNYASKTKLEHATEIDTSDLAAKRDFVALKAEVGKLDINKQFQLVWMIKNKKRWLRCW